MNLRRLNKKRGCAVCRDQMLERRNNYSGWTGKPFELVAVSIDTSVQDLVNKSGKVVKRHVSRMPAEACYRIAHLLW